MDWIEGIGSTTHPFYASISLGTPGSISELLCFHRSDIKIYQNPNFPGCEVNSYLTHFLPDSNSYFSVSEEKFWFHGDTVIGEQLYKKVYRQWGADADFDKAQYYAGVREDTLQGKIYCLHNASEQERLVADYGVEPGEQVSVYCFFPFGETYEKSLTVKEVDSVDIDGELRKRVHLESTNYAGLEDIWIEGFGSRHGLFYPFPFGHAVDVGEPWLLCVHVDGAKIYQNPYFEGCYKSLGVGISEPEEDNSFVSVSYANGGLMVESNAQNSWRYKIFNSGGKLLKEGHVVSGPVNVSDLKPGVYIISLEGEEGLQVFSDKFGKY